MDERRRILADLKRWVRQAQREGVERVVFDEAACARAFAAAREAGIAAAPAADGDDARIAAPAFRGGGAPDFALAPDAAGGAAPAGARRGDASLQALLLHRHPDWAGTPLIDLAEEIAACEACGLCAGRRNTVPGTGHPRAKLAFVGEAPGGEEDRQGIPFVGRAGQLLDKMLAAIDMKREDVHILNILKCRPPENRNPAPDEIAACRHFLERQIELIRPGILVALGLFAGQWLTGQRLSLTKLRETGPYAYQGVPVFVTYHPAALLRNPEWKRPAWEDFKTIRREVETL